MQLWHKCVSSKGNNKNCLELTGEFCWGNKYGCDRKYHLFYVVFPLVAVLEFRTDKLYPINKAALIALLGHLFGTVKFTFQPLAGFNDGEGSPHTQCYFWDTPGMIATYQRCQQISLPMKAQRSKLLAEQKANLPPIQSFSFSQRLSFIHLSSSTHLSTTFI